MTPLIFISHKHSDKAIAETVAKFLETEATRQLRIFLSSSPGFEGVRFGKQISGDLKTVLADADVFLLVYTSADEDWSWCMWEWGVANHPASAKTTMVVLQCGTEAPKIDTGTRRVNVRQHDEVRAFVKQYFTAPAFFPSLNDQAFGAHFSENTLLAKADTLFKSLISFPAIDPTTEWQTWPFLQLKMPVADVARIKDLVSPLDHDDQLSLVKEQARVEVADTKALTLFGLAGLATDTPWKNLALQWKYAFDGKEPDWFDSSCEQILIAAAEKLPSTKAVPLQAVNSDKSYIPIITRVRRSSYQGTVRFDLYFVEESHFADASLAERMLTLDQFYWRRLSDETLQTKLTTLRTDLEAQGKSRLPLLDDNKQIKYVIHRGSIGEFIASNLSRAQDLTLQDFLVDPAMLALVTETFAIVGRGASVEDCKRLSRRGVRDVFITATGSPEEPVEGWLTNVDVL
jgi:hypothetical protein